LYNNFDTTANLYDGMVNDKIAPFFETEGSIKDKATFGKVKRDCQNNPNSKQCKVGIWVLKKQRRTSQFTESRLGKIIKKELNRLFFLLQNFINFF
jgi:hypothetical protein